MPTPTFGPRRRRQRRDSIRRISSRTRCHALVCDGSVSLAEAQHDLASNCTPLMPSTSLVGGRFTPSDANPGARFLGGACIRVLPTERGLEELEGYESQYPEDDEPYN